MKPFPLGPVMLDIAGTAVAVEERDLLRHPHTGGVILFARNFESTAQLKALTAEIRSLREPQLLIAVDHEGGRVQRFRSGFTRIPPMGALGGLWEKGASEHGGGPEAARGAAEAAGVVIGAELADHGLDFSFAPVLDLDFGRCAVIGDRAFCRDPGRAADLAESFIRGLKAAGSASVGKHFPGHGYVQADSHLAIPVDERSYAELEREDLVPYARLIPAGLDGIMPAHVIYPAVDALPAGFSTVWLQQVLRGRLGFHGLIFSDDLSMEGASGAGGIVERGEAALRAGCDMVLVCNDPSSAALLLDRLEAGPASVPRTDRMRALPRNAAMEARYRAALAILQPLAE
jgi:beta-N-acetylhexosaminidase